MGEEVINGEETDIIYEKLCFGEILYLRKDFDNMLQDIEIAVELDNRNAFLEGLVMRLKYLGADIVEADVEGILKELKERYQRRMGKAVPKTVKEWVRGTTPGTENRRNNYELCYALEMDINDTAVFFIKNFLSIPYNYKDSIDAIFFYCILNNKTYDVVKNMIEKADMFIPRDNVMADTVEIGRNIAEIDSDEEFLNYISEHCYNNEQQFQVARNKIKELVDEIKKTLADAANEDRTIKLNEDRMINLIVDNIFGFSYQKNIKINLSDSKSKDSFKYVRDTKLPKKFVKSIPRNGVLGDILKGKEETYETLRKTLVILYFYNFFYDIENTDEDDIRNNALDFYEEINQVLFECGFAQIYVRHPFDYLMIFCAISPEPMETFWKLNEFRYKYIEK